MIKTFRVYIMVGAAGTLYVGFTSNIAARVHQHAIATDDAFTGKYNINRLVYAEAFDDPIAAISREKKIKRWRREKKIALVDKYNPNWKTIDLS
jgi:putative endonuclease